MINRKAQNTKSYQLFVNVGQIPTKVTPSLQSDANNDRHLEACELIFFSLSIVMCFKYEASGLINVFDRFSLLEIMIQLLLILCPGWQKVAAFQRLQKIPQVFCVSNFHDINAVFENLYVSTAGPAPLGPQLLPPCLCLILSQSHLTVHTL